MWRWALWSKLKNKGGKLRGAHLEERIDHMAVAQFQ